VIGSGRVSTGMTTAAATDKEVFRSTIPARIRGTVEDPQQTRTRPTGAT